MKQYIRFDSENAVDSPIARLSIKVSNIVVSGLPSRTG